MPVLKTNNFGKISYQPQSELEFPRSLPGFENRRGFVAVRFAETDPLIYLQSLDDPDLSFITMPILAVDPRYRLTVSEEDLEQVGLPTTRQPRIGDDVLCLTVLSMRETGPTANLLAPVVVNLRTRKAVQAVAQEPGYSHRYRLLPDERDAEPAPLAEEASVCS